MRLERSTISTLVMRSVLGGLMRRILRRVRLLERLRAVERVDLHACVKNAHDRRHTHRVAIEKFRAENLRCQTDIGDGRRVSVAKPAGLPRRSEMPLDR